MRERFVNWDEPKIKALLRDKYGKYNPANDTEYLSYLSRVERTEQANTPEEIKRRRQLADTQHGPAVCPICGASIIPDMDFYAKVYKLPGWRCTTGGLQHYLWWRANNVRRLCHEPLAFEEKVPYAQDITTKGL